LLSELETTGIARVAEIERLASNGDFDALAEAAHSLKGAVATLAAEPLRALCAAIEAAGQARAEEQLRQLARQLDDEMRRCLDFIPVFRAGNAGNPGPRGRMVQR
jgi:HPt (histidine-containing phosphotransfer) domain-containing protein